MPDARQPGTLYVVATPLGNLEDMTLRAMRVLREVALVACEDTRRTAQLLRAPRDRARRRRRTSSTTSAAKGARILEALRAGRDVALVSDAGTPGISDPGYRLVREARAAALPVVPVPGPSAAIAALSVVGPAHRPLPVRRLPALAGGARRRGRSRSWPRSRETLVFYESPRARGRPRLEDMPAAFGDREAFLCREATKVHEEYVRGTLVRAARSLRARDEVRGEIVLVVAGAGTRPPRPTETPETLFARLVAEGRTRREAVKETARHPGLPARDVYEGCCHATRPFERGRRLRADR